MLLTNDPYVINFYRGQDVGSHSAALFAESCDLPVEIKEIAREHRSPDRFREYAVPHPKRVGHLNREVPAHRVCRVCSHHAVDVDCRLIEYLIPLPVHDKIVVADRGKPGKSAPDCAPGGLPAGPVRGLEIVSKAGEGAVPDKIEPSGGGSLGIKPRAPACPRPVGVVEQGELRCSDGLPNLPGQL